MPKGTVKSVRPPGEESQPVIAVGELDEMSRSAAQFLVPICQKVQPEDGEYVECTRARGHDEGPKTVRTFDPNTTGKEPNGARLHVAAGLDYRAVAVWW